MKNIKDVPIGMFVGKKDHIVDTKDNRWVNEQIGEAVVRYQELELDHLSFLLAEDMSYFDQVLELIDEHNPVSQEIKQQIENQKIDYLLKQPLDFSSIDVI